jgi:hypothetical protein
MEVRVRLMQFASLGLLLGSLTAHSQCLPLQVLTKEVADGHLSPPNLAPYLPSSEWQFHQPATGTAYWSFIGIETNVSAPSTPETRVELRRSNQQDQYDVVYKTTRKNCFNDLRAELRRTKLKAEPVTCLQCEGERFTGMNYTVTTYNQQVGFAQGKTPYPYVLVIHPVVSPSVSK